MGGCAGKTLHGGLCPRPGCVHILPWDACCTAASTCSRGGQGRGAEPFPAGSEPWVLLGCLWERLTPAPPAPRGTGCQPVRVCVWGGVGGVLSNTQRIESGRRDSEVHTHIWSTLQLFCCLSESQVHRHSGPFPGQLSGTAPALQDCHEN